VRKVNLDVHTSFQLDKLALKALIENQHRLREESHSHVSLIHALRYVDSDKAMQTLNHLGLGSYDGTLLGKNSASILTSQLLNNTTFEPRAAPRDRLSGE
jgi:hypothetical protein